jgi:hypothetical protein
MSWLVQSGSWAFLGFFGERRQQRNLRLNQLCLLPNYYYIFKKGSEFQDGVWCSKKERD